MNSTNKIRLGIVDDDRLIVQLLKPLVEASGKIIVTLTAHSGNDFLQQVDRGALLDVVLLDLRMNNGSGLDVLDRMHHGIKRMKIIVLSTFYKKNFIGQMVKLGADAFLPKAVDQGELIETIEEVYKRGHYFTHEQITVISTQISSRTPKYYIPSKQGLTVREIEVLRLICQQMSTKEIAAQLFISPKTVETHKSNLMAKTGVKNMAGLVIYAAQNKIINPDELILLEQ